MLFLKRCICLAGELARRSERPVRGEQARRLNEFPWRDERPTLSVAAFFHGVVFDLCDGLGQMRLVVDKHLPAALGPDWLIGARPQLGFCPFLCRTRFQMSFNPF